jgi:arachidonate 15-lipoxygenase
MRRYRDIADRICQSSMEKLRPPAEQDLTQMEVIFALNGIFWGRLGSSELIPFLDKGDRSVLEEFQNKLVEVEHQINARNQQRLLNTGIEYPYLLPSRIPNSINI